MRQLDVKEMEAVNGGCAALENVLKDAGTWASSVVSSIGQEVQSFFASKEFKDLTYGMSVPEFFNKLFGG